jgi:hypothetical protein
MAKKTRERKEKEEQQKQALQEQWKAETLEKNTRESVDAEQYLKPLRHNVTRLWSPGKAPREIREEQLLKAAERGEISEREITDLISDFNDE